MSIDSEKYSTAASGGPLTGVRILDLTTVVFLGHGAERLFKEIVFALKMKIGDAYTETRLAGHHLHRDL